MPGWFIIGFILAIIAVPSLLIAILLQGPRGRKPEGGWTGTDKSRVETKETFGAIALVAGVLSVLCLVISAYNPVGTKDVGIVTSFGATAGHRSSGLNFTWPWEKIHQMSAAIQTDSYTTDKTCITARIANQQTGCAYISIRWRINPNKSDLLYQNYKTFDNVRDSLVTRDLTAAINKQLANYNPLNSVIGGTLPKGQHPNPALATVAQRITNQMTKEIGGKNGSIEVLNTILPIVTFDNETQSRINQLQQQVALTRIAQQAQDTAVAQATANKDLAKSVNNSPNVLVSTCLGILENMVKNNQPVPAGFSCWPGGSLTGVIANATTPTATNTTK